MKKRGIHARPALRSKGPGIIERTLSIILRYSGMVEPFPRQRNFIHMKRDTAQEKSAHKNEDECCLCQVHCLSCRLLLIKVSMSQTVRILTLSTIH